MYNCLIVGAGRSGTSMIAGCLSNSGYYMGDKLIPARAANPKGFFESSLINHGVNEALMAKRAPNYVLGQRWLADLPVDVTIPRNKVVEGKIKKLLARTPFCYKDPRMSYTLPVWMHHVDKKTTKIVCAFRHPASTIASVLKECKIAKYLRNFPMDERRAGIVWQRMYEHITTKHMHNGAEWLFVHYDSLFTDPGLDRLSEFLDAPVDRGFPDRRYQRKIPGIKIRNKKIRKLYKQLCDLGEAHAHIRR